MVIAVLLLIAPGIISSAYYCSLKKTSFKTVDFIVYAVIFAFLINMFVIGISYLRGHGAAVPEALFSSVGNVIKYGLLALAASLALPNILLVISKFHRGKKNG
jgi:hypothetical protein